MKTKNPNFYMSVHCLFQYVNERLSSGLLSFRRCKGRDKKKVYETSSYTSTGISNTSNTNSTLSVYIAQQNLLVAGTHPLIL